MAKSEIDFSDIDTIVGKAADGNDVSADAIGILARELRKIRVALDHRNDLLEESNRMQADRDTRAIKYEAALLGKPIPVAGMPHICDRCGVSVAPGNHDLFDFEIWGDGSQRSDEWPPGRLCMVCGDELHKRLLAFAKENGLTSYHDGRLRNVGHGGRVALEKRKEPVST